MVESSPEGIDWFNVAHKLGHTSARMLGNIGKKITSLPKSENIPHTDTFQLAALFHKVREEEYSTCIHAIISFQAMMEGIINETVTSESALSHIKERDRFADKWNGAYKFFGCDEGDQTHLDDYLTFYRKYRNGIIHPKTSGHVITHSPDYRFYNVYRGFYSGWHAFKALYEKRDIPHDKDSWGTFCEMNDLPKSANESDYPCLHQLRSALFKKHLEHFNSKL